MNLFRKILNLFKEAGVSDGSTLAILIVVGTGIGITGIAILWQVLGWLLLPLILILICTTYGYFNSSILTVEDHPAIDQDEETVDHEDPSD